MCACTGSIVPAGLIILMTFLNCSQAYAAVGVMIVGVGFFGLQYPGCMVNHADIAPPFSGILFGISNTFATIPGIIAPYVVGILAPKVSHSHANQSTHTNCRFSTINQKFSLNRYKL
jgi:ACS family sodium-dependent inorganic phosphate cotransporter-like MFS transporter 5